MIMIMIVNLAPLAVPPGIRPGDDDDHDDDDDGANDHDDSYHHDDGDRQPGTSVLATWHQTRS